MALQNLPPLYYINLDERKEKRVYMDNLLTKHNIQGSRICATNGHLENSNLLNKHVIMSRLKNTEIACTISHLRAIQEWLTTSDTETALICEDDLSFDTVEYWSFTWKDVMDRLPYYWDIFQCCITYHPLHPPTISLHVHQTTDFSCVCYLINRRYAEKLMSLYWRDGSWKLDYFSAYPLTAEEVLYKPGVCISLPLFTYTNEFESSIQTKEHMKLYHVPSREFIVSIWKQIHKSNLDLLNLYKPVTLQPMMKQK